MLRSSLHGLTPSARVVALVALLNGCTCGQLQPDADASVDAVADHASECSTPVTPDCGADAIAAYAVDGGCGAAAICVAVRNDCPPIVPPGQGCTCCDNHPTYFSQCLYDGKSPIPLTGKYDCFDQ